MAPQKCGYIYVCCAFLSCGVPHSVPAIWPAYFVAVPGPWYGLRELKVLGDRTSLDTYIAGTDGSGRLVGVGIEVKYTDVDIELADPNLFA